MNKKLKLLNLLLIILLLVFQYFVVLSDHTALPSQEWSRSFPTNTNSGNYAKIHSVPTDNGYAISLLDFKKMDILDCSAAMDCTLKSTNLELNPYKNTWSDGDVSYFIHEDSLIRSSSSENTTIASNVENFTKSNQSLVYWLKNNEVVIQQGEDQPISFSPEFPVHTSMIVNEQVFVITNNLQENIYTVLDGANDFVELFQFYLNPSENLSSMQIADELDSKKYNLLLDTEILSAGKRTKVIRNASFDLSQNQEPSLTKLKFVDQESGSELTDIRFPLLLGGENGPSITFSAYTYDKTGEKTNNVFSGNYDSPLIKASAVTKNDYYVQPIFLNNQTIAYFKLDGKEKTLMYSSATEEQRLLSEKVQEGDYKEALFSLIGLLINGFALVLLAFIWIIPALGIAYGILALLQKSHKPFAHAKAFYLNIFLLLFSQLVSFSTIIHPERMLSKAPYLTEVWHVYLVIFIASIACVLPVFLSRTKVTEDNFNSLILYTTAMNLIIILLIFGPYFI